MRQNCVIKTQIQTSSESQKREVRNIPYEDIEEAEWSDDEDEEDGPAAAYGGHETGSHRCLLRQPADNLESSLNCVSAEGHAACCTGPDGQRFLGVREAEAVRSQVNHERFHEEAVDHAMNSRMDWAATENQVVLNDLLNAVIAKPTMPEEWALQPDPGRCGSPALWNSHCPPAIN